MLSLRSTVFSLGVLLATALNVSVAQADTAILSTLQFERPTRNPGTGSPSSRSDGATRGEECLIAGTSLNALVPTEQKDGDTIVEGMTQASTPTLWFHLSQPITNGTVQLQLRSVDGKTLHTHSAELPATAGILPIELPQDLDIGDSYRWIMRIDVTCPNNDFRTLSVNGWVHRLEQSEEISNAASEVSLEEQAVLYAQAGLWYDTLAILMELYQTNPNDANVTSALNRLMDQIGLDISLCAPVAQAET